MGKASKKTTTSNASNKKLKNNPSPSTHTGRPTENNATDADVTKKQPFWDDLPPKFQKITSWMMWFITWLGLLEGNEARHAWEAVVFFSFVHFSFFYVIMGYDVSKFPVQVRLVYVFWVLIGTYVPYMNVLMKLSTVGLSLNLFAGYDPLERFVSLLKWNRDEELSVDLMKTAFLSSPKRWRFKPPQKRLSSDAESSSAAGASDENKKKS